ncbi:type I phosphomannose isomerase catalytic subunit [Flavobacterium agrisoli]|uniref:Phosphohexomutase n=1 Tax=Flavobacterium agrisoli TaxID=2793066 RepID=A0A934UKA8_9FLAO|nr:type I phosphomannose isomerase catalytic subunit [Flavobacterium agrisoli]MBK0370772.1 class I mannose-6-phosphate isomerase [Flavobacterium agrisoli]
MNVPFYPLQFNPILKDRIWGGQKLKTQFNKPIPSATTGESWEISTVPGDISVVEKGAFQGQSLTELIDQFPEKILGTQVFKKFGKQFPLLFKFLDAREDLSIQVHPNDELAQKRHNSFGKTEMWYVMQADTGARIIVGFKEDSNKEEYLEHLENKTLLSILDTVEAKVGDVFFLETGTVHAIGAGLVIAEIQQTSDITYRLYDFDRKDANGNTRELHVDLALDAINYKKVQTQKKYDIHVNQSNNMVDCPYFTTNFIPLDGAKKVQKNTDSFTVYMCVEGSFSIEINEQRYEYKKGDTVLLPAQISELKLNGNASILEIYIS